MRSAAQCLAKAAEIAEMAEQTQSPEGRARFLVLALEWQRAAVEAARQDGAVIDATSEN
ncbi:hypothetical protein QO010_004013 [Caulobacter ginsengisoli]|uniref:DUF982 domain-containing protein n=1 Tax=Caulobacter ginsengisoli TaxID=400775 RepID=A0ABU0IW37_9CAUL|nr:hypothetical protein [Caulobacter ginsengisoli]MDQ0466220.1 hypothetical protein [Caulobacter ginsengisoli]